MLFRFPSRELEIPPWIPAAKVILEAFEGSSYEAPEGVLPYLTLYLGEPKGGRFKSVITFEKFKGEGAEVVLSTREVEGANVVVRASSPEGFLRALRLEPKPLEWFSQSALNKALEAWRRRGYYKGRLRVFSDGKARKEEEEVKSLLGAEVMFARPGEEEPVLELALLATADLYLGGESFHTGLAGLLGLRGVVRGPRELASGRLLPQGNLRRLLKEMGFL